MIYQKLAIVGGEPVREKSFPVWPTFDRAEQDALQAVLESHEWWQRDGVQVKNFQAAFAKYHGCQYGLAVSSGTQAIEVALAALDIGEGDEVIIPAYSFASTLTAVMAMKAFPRIVDVCPLSYCIDPDEVERAINPRTRAIMPVHVAGHVADMDSLADLASQKGVCLIEDCAHAHGSEWRGKRVGLFSSLAIFSFHQVKLMTSGEGGIVITNDEQLLEKCLLHANCGRSENDRVYNHIVSGCNARLTEFQAALLNAQLSRLDQQIELRERNYWKLRSLLERLPGIDPQARDSRVTRDPHYNVIFRYNAAEFGGLPRNRFVECMNAEGIPASIAYRPLHRLPFFQSGCWGPRWKGERLAKLEVRDMRLPDAEAIGSEGVCLHHRLLLGDESDVNDIAKCIEKISRYTSANPAFTGG